ncbi:MAG: MFS transporter, partial [Nocardioidaceae bacterium]
ATHLALVTTAGAAVALVANPLGGALSDRTTSRFGRRRPWVVGAALLGGLALVLLGRQTTLAGVVIGWCLAQLFLNVQLAGLIAAVPDQVPVRQRGLVSGLVGLAQPLGVVVGVVVVTRVVVGVPPAYLLIGCALLVTALCYVAGGRDTRLPREARPSFSWSRFLAGFWISPRRHPDFAWAWLTRFLVNLSQALGIGYLIYFLEDAVGLASGQAAQGVSTLVGVYTGALLLTVVPAGWLSDRLQRRRVFVVCSALAIAAGTAVIAVWQTWPAALLAAAVQGLGFGAYVAVDVALITQVLPVASEHAKDLGVLNIANTFPQMVAPGVAAVLITRVGGYAALFGGAAVITLLGGVLVTRIRGVP